MIFHFCLDGQSPTYILGIYSHVQDVYIKTVVLMAEILRVSGRISNHGFSDYDRLQRGSPNPVASLDLMPDVGGKALGSWNGSCWSSIQHEVS